jgi:hypothetical protein
VAAVSPVQLNPVGDTAIMIVTPTTGPQDPRTEDLVRTLRADVIPAAIAGSDRRQRCRCARRRGNRGVH